MDKTYQKFLKSGIDLAALGVGRGENETYFCTPRGASFIGWEGVDGIHYCFVRGVQRRRVRSEPGKRRAGPRPRRGAGFR